MKITKNPSTVTIEFSPQSYWLRKNTNDPEFLGEYCLTYRIDMSYKGKCDQEGAMVMFLDNNQVEIFREAGFDEIE